MKVQKWSISRTDLREIPENERALFVLLGHVVNELNVLNEMFYLCTQYREEPKWRVHAHSSQALVFARVLTGKLYEGWKLLRKGYFESQISKSYDEALHDEARDSLKRLRRYFGKENLIKDIRNNFSFHYSVDDTKSALSKDLLEEELRNYMAENNGNTLYYLSEYVINTALLDAIAPNDPETALNRLIDESAQVVGWFNETAGGIMARIAELYLLGSDGKLPLEPIDIGEVPMAEKVEIPYFFDSEFAHEKKRLSEAQHL